MKILISAAEASSDVHGAQLLRQIQALCPPGKKVQAYGVGGPELQAAGLQAVVDARELLSMGFLEIVGRLPRIIGALNAVTEAAKAERPDVAVVIDYPDFHFRLARRLKKLGIPVVYYIPPKVWAWRKGRIRQLQELFARILCIFPFERDFFERAGLPIRYVGNPLLDELPLGTTREQARARLGLGATEKVLTLMPGSRPSELRRHLEVVLEASVRLTAKLRSQGALGGEAPLRVLIPLPQTADLAAIRERVDRWASKGNWGQGRVVDIRVMQGNSAECLIASDGALIKSGTSTLEASLLGCPHTVLYKASIITWWIYKYLIRYQGPIALTNLVAGRRAGQPLVANELIGPYATPESLAEDLMPLLTDPAKRARTLEELASIRSRLSMEGAASPSALAAREVLGLVPI